LYRQVATLADDLKIEAMRGLTTTAMRCAKGEGVGSPGLTSSADLGLVCRVGRDV
jgi:hypothetical protein